MSIFEHLSYRGWLESWFSEKKKENPNFSHRMIARLCHQKSPSFFKDVTTGRRNLTDDQETRLLTLMNLTDEEIRYFRDLVIFDQESSLAMRTEAFERVSAVRRRKFSYCLEGEQYQYLSRWYLPAIREMALCKGFQCDPEWIASHLNPPIRVEEAKEALDILLSLQFLILEDDGSHSVPEISITTPNQVIGLAVHNYHQQMLKLASESIQRHLESERHMLGVTVSIPESMVPTVKEELNQMASRLLDLCDGVEGERDITIQLGVHMFPLTK